MDNRPFRSLPLTVLSREAAKRAFPRQAWERETPEYGAVPGIHGRTPWRKGANINTIQTTGTFSPHLRRVSRELRLVNGQPFKETAVMLELVHLDKKLPKDVYRRVFPELEAQLGA